MTSTKTKSIVNFVLKLSVNFSPFRNNGGNRISSTPKNNKNDTISCSACRRDQVNKFWEDGNVWIGPSLGIKPLDESKKEEDNND